MHVLVAIPVAMIFIMLCAVAAYIIGLFGIGVLALIEKLGYPIMIPALLLFIGLIVYTITRIRRRRKVVLAEEEAFDRGERGV